MKQSMDVCARCGRTLEQGYYQTQGGNVCVQCATELGFANTQPCIQPNIQLQAGAFDNQYANVTQPNAFSVQNNDFGSGNMGMQQQGMFGNAQNMQQSPFGTAQNMQQNAFDSTQNMQQSPFGNTQNMQQGVFGNAQNMQQGAFGNAQSMQQGAFGNAQNMQQGVFDNSQGNTVNPFEGTQQGTMANGGFSTGQGTGTEGAVALNPFAANLASSQATQMPENLGGTYTIDSAGSMQDDSYKKENLVFKVGKKPEVDAEKKARKAEQKKKNKKFAPIIVILLLLAICGGLYYFLKIKPLQPDKDGFVSRVVTDVEGNAVTDESGNVVTSYVSVTTVIMTDENGLVVTDKKGNYVTDTSVEEDTETTTEFNKYVAQVVTDESGNPVTDASGAVVTTNVEVETVYMTDENGLIVTDRDGENMTETVTVAEGTTVPGTETAGSGDSTESSVESITDPEDGTGNDTGHGDITEPDVMITPTKLDTPEGANGAYSVEISSNYGTIKSIGIAVNAWDANDAEIADFEQPVFIFTPDSLKIEDNKVYIEITSIYSDETVALAKFSVYRVEFEDGTVVGSDEYNPFTVLYNYTL